MRPVVAGRRGARRARWKTREMEGVEMKEAEMGNMEARTRSALILVAFEVELLLSCSVKTTIYAACALFDLRSVYFTHCPLTLT